MPDSFDTKLEQLLEINPAPDGEAFVLDVMRSIQREQRIRQLILWVFGLVGALFGLAGVMMLSAPVGQALTEIMVLPVMETMQVSLFVTAVAALYLWFMNDDLSLGS